MTSAVDAEPQFVARITGPAWITVWAAIFTGGAFIFPTFHWYPPAIVSGLLAIACVIYWLWTSTALIPEKPMKDVGLGLRLPVYVSGPKAPGWWGVFITMLGDATAFASLIFGVFFYWTSRPDFPPEDAVHADVPWTILAACLFAASWAATRAARGVNRAGGVAGARLLLGAAPVLGLAGGVALVLAVKLPGLAPVSHVYPAMMWGLVVWACAHLAAGVIMQCYCLAGSIFGKLTPRYDADLWNTTLFWHFLLVTCLVTTAMIGLVPRMM